ncbi:alpha/beta hydrolase [Streptomyces otsuchiensis]|uniref:alpha/beta hydrolase n=1 Tax=Streptomyces otsuchiensis TaxID=2681388 RepID=UPI001030E7DC|nr:alpha/beta hydrolase [Streptomyces otsuchiensis]
MKRSRSIVRTSALLAVVGLTVPLATAHAVAEEPDGPEVRWSACPDDVLAEAAPVDLECATVPVPVDYSDPDGEQIDLLISRVASASPDQRRGTLMLNPGGPGGSGLALPALLVNQGIPASVLDTFDLIGMDTRGVGHSAPVGCGFTLEGDYYSNVPPYAADDAAVLAHAEVVRQAAEDCERNDSDGLLAHLTTANMARDLDTIRAALGEEKTSYLGYSYGSALGAAYASMFPERSDRIVLDSNIGDTHLDRDGMRRFAHGLEETFPHFANWAAARHDSYRLGSTPEEVRETYFVLAESLDEEPVAGFDGVTLRHITFAMLYKPSQYPKLAQQWQALATGDEEAARLLSEEITPTQEGPSIDNPISVFAAVTCNDVKWSTEVDDYRQAVAEDRETYPLFGAAAANITPCAFWAYEPTEPPVAVNDDGPQNVLLVQNKLDPATPHLGAELLREKFEDRSRLLSVDDSGHGVYVLGGNSCALNTTTRYLVDGEMPADDVLCPAD